jgi:hypothetical protein
MNVLQLLLLLYLYTPYMCIYIFVYESRDISVGIATDYGLDDRMLGFRISGGAENF